MKKIVFVCLFILVGVFVSLAQEKKLPFAVGISHEWVEDAGKGYLYANSITCDYTTRREKIAIEVLYGLSKRWYLSSAAGVSFYNSDMYMGRLSVANTVGVSVSKPTLLLSQKVLYDLVQWHPAGFIGLKASPFMALAYEPFFSKAESSGFSDLNSNEAVQFMETQNLPALSAQTKTPAGLFSIAGGLSLEVVLFKKIGVSYHLGYAYSLFGHSQMDVEYRYADDEIHTLHFKSEDRGISQKAGIRYYF
ncbi:MAG: hypothetical protein LBP50_04340 [Tannerella sp.]|nr:hypothetical protein [Tannerella sp.]